MAPVKWSMREPQRAVEVETWEEQGEAGRRPGDGQCQTRVSGLALRTPEELRGYPEFADRCPNEAQALIWNYCENGHQCDEEVCAGHVSPAGVSICARCAADGLAVGNMVIFIRWL